MTDLYLFTVASRDPKTGVVVLKVKVLYKEAGNPPNQIHFAFRVIHEYMSFQAYSNYEQNAEGEWKLRAQPYEGRPPLADELDPDDFPADKWVDKNASAYIKSSIFDKKNKTLTITPTHPGWTEHCIEGTVSSSTAYSYSQDNPEPGDANYHRPLTPVDRSVPKVAGASMTAGFKLKIREQARQEISKKGGGIRRQVRIDTEMPAPDLLKRQQVLYKKLTKEYEVILKAKKAEIEKRKAQRKKAGKPKMTTTTKKKKGKKRSTNVFDEEEEEEEMADDEQDDNELWEVESQKPEGYDMVPCRKMLHPIYPAARYTAIPLKKDETAVDLIYQPVVVNTGVGEDDDEQENNTGVGLLTFLEPGQKKRDGVYFSIAYDGSSGSIEEKKIIGRAVLAKPRKRLPWPKEDQVKEASVKRSKRGRE